MLCYVMPELMWQALSESLPLTLILALTWSFLYTVCTSDWNLDGQSSFSNICVLSGHGEKLLWITLVTKWWV